MAIDYKMMISEAFLKLCKTKKIDKITIDDIKETTGVSRQTFYNHFTDKYELVNWIWHYRIVGHGQFDENNSMFGYINKAMHRFEEYKDFVIQATEMQETEYFIDYMVNHNYNNYRTLFLMNHTESIFTPELEYAMRFNAYGIAYMHIKWIKEGMKISANEMTTYEVNVIPEIMKKLLREDGII